MVSFYLLACHYLCLAGDSYFYQRAVLRQLASPESLRKLGILALLFSWLLHLDGVHSENEKTYQENSLVLGLMLFSLHQVSVYPNAVQRIGEWADWIPRPHPTITESESLGILYFQASYCCVNSLKRKTP